MAVEGLTLLQIQDQVARNLMGSTFKVGTASANSDGTILIDETLRGGGDSHTGKYLLFTTGTNIGSERQVSDYAQDVPPILTISKPTLTATIVDGDGYRMYDTGAQYSFSTIRDAINDAIISTRGRYYKREESLFHHADRVHSRFPLPSEFDMVDKVELRHIKRSKQIATTQTVWDAEAGANAGDLIASITTEARDYSAIYTHAELWVRSSVALDAADLHLLLDDTAGGGSPIEELAIPAMDADTWTYVRVPFTDTENLTDIIHVAIRMTVDKGAFVLRLDDIKAVDHDSSTWQELPKHLWRIDREAGDLVLSQEGRIAAGYSLLKISGGSNPAELTALTDVSTVPEQYLILQATADLLYGGSRATGNDPDGRRTLGDRFQVRATRARGTFPPLVNCRKVS